MLPAGYIPPVGGGWGPAQGSEGGSCDASFVGLQANGNVRKRRNRQSGDNVAGDYKPLRVPVALIQQHIFATSHRLPPWEGMVEAEDKPWTPPKWVTTRKYDSQRGWYSADDEPSVWPGQGATQSEYSVLRNLFDKIPHMRKFFVLVDGVNQTKCRNCGKMSKSNAERAGHVCCYPAITQTLKQLLKTESCVICEESIVKTDVFLDYNDVPVCGLECLSIWDTMVPQAFELVLNDVKKVGGYA